MSLEKKIQNYFFVPKVYCTLEKEESHYLLLLQVSSLHSEKQNISTAMEIIWKSGRRGLFRSI
jgi:hypothetical protein